MELDSSTANQGGSERGEPSWTLKTGKEFFKTNWGEGRREKDILGDTDDMQKGTVEFTTHAGDKEWTCLEHTASVERGSRPGL